MKRQMLCTKNGSVEPNRLIQKPTTPVSGICRNVGKPCTHRTSGPREPSRRKPGSAYSRVADAAPADTMLGSLSPGELSGGGAHLAPLTVGEIRELTACRPLAPPPLNPFELSERGGTRPAMPARDQGAPQESFAASLAELVARDPTKGRVDDRLR